MWGGTQVYIKATGEQSAEMVTDEGAIYVTSNRGYNWKAAVQETVSATLNRYKQFFTQLIDAKHWSRILLEMLLWFDEAHLGEARVFLLVKIIHTRNETKYLKSCLDHLLFFSFSKRCVPRWWIKPWHCPLHFFLPCVCDAEQFQVALAVRVTTLGLSTQWTGHLMDAMSLYPAEGTSIWHGSLGRSDRTSQYVLHRSVIVVFWSLHLHIRISTYMQPFWQPHNRAVARRIQNMGWRADGGLWLLVRGGGLFLSKGTGVLDISLYTLQAKWGNKQMHALQFVACPSCSFKKKLLHVLARNSSNGFPCTDNWRLRGGASSEPGVWHSWCRLPLPGNSLIM